MKNAFPEEYKKYKEMTEKIGLPIIVLVTFSYFFILFLMPILILSLIVWIFNISIGSSYLTAIAIVTFIGYFTCDLYRVSISKFSLTMVVLIAITTFVLAIFFALNEGKKFIITWDTTTPNKIKERIFPLNFML